MGTELEAQLFGHLGTDASASGGVQLEQHIWKGVSVTGQIGGTCSPGSTTLMFAGCGFTVHLDAF